MKKHVKAIPADVELLDLKKRLNNGRCSIRKLSKQLYGDKNSYHLYKVLDGTCYDPEALSHLRKLAETGNVSGIEHRRGGGRPIRKKDSTKLIKCKCPYCGEFYNRNKEDLNWTNPFIKVPRIYCDSCLQIISPSGGDREDWESLERKREEEFKAYETSERIWTKL
jgi:hypothetical protein